jgi:hypothetical protein
LTKAIGLTYAALARLRPCEERELAAVASIGSHWRKTITAAEAAAKGVPLKDLIWVASALSKNDKDIERRLRLWMADCAAHVLPLFTTKFPDDKRVENTIIAARHFARCPTEAAAWSAAWSAARSAAWSAEEKWQTERFIAWFSENEPEDYNAKGL